MLEYGKNSSVGLEGTFVVRVISIKEICFCIELQPFHTIYKLVCHHFPHVQADTGYWAGGIRANRSYPLVHMYICSWFFAVTAMA